jgi:hypothetical protein
MHDLALGCVYEIAHCELRACAVSLFSHTHVCTAFPGTEGAQHIAAALAHNSTLQTLK